MSSDAGSSAGNSANNSNTSGDGGIPATTTAPPPTAPVTNEQVYAVVLAMRASLERRCQELLETNRGMIDDIREEIRLMFAEFNARMAEMVTTVDKLSAIVSAIENMVGVDAVAAAILAGAKNSSSSSSSSNKKKADAKPAAATITTTNAPHVVGSGGAGASAGDASGGGGDDCDCDDCSKVLPLHHRKSK